MCQEVALRFTNRTDFSKNYYTMYKYAKINNWINEICQHMIIIGNLKYRCVYVYEFPNNYAYVGLSGNLERRNEKRKNQTNDGVTKYINKTKLIPKLKQLSEYVEVNLARILEKDLINNQKENISLQSH